MAWKVGKCTEADMPRFFEIISLAFKNDHEYIDSVFPGHDTPTGRAFGPERMLAVMKTDPDTTFLKIVDDQDEIVAGAKWNIYSGGVPEKPELEGDSLENATGRKFARNMFDGYLVPRFRSIRESGGNLAARVGVKMLDGCWSNGAQILQTSSELSEAVVGAGDDERGLYAQEGFEVLEKFECPVPGEFAFRRKQWFW